MSLRHQPRQWRIPGFRDEGLCGWWIYVRVLGKNRGCAIAVIKSVYGCHPEEKILRRDGSRAHPTRGIEGMGWFETAFNGVICTV